MLECPETHALMSGYLVLLSPSGGLFLVVSSSSQDWKMRPCRTRLLIPWVCLVFSDDYISRHSLYWTIWVLKLRSVTAASRLWNSQSGTAAPSLGLSLASHLWIVAPGTSQKIRKLQCLVPSRYSVNISSLPLWKGIFCLDYSTVRL